ncbi:bZIP transcription factor 60 [Platanthera zijinensis]|uniref:BZIP transcription factor 60 n=1 Tax=Platanthera zijinensis TaxID=2320716 RepID=A0AAP0BF33_9ASPA
MKVIPLALRPRNRGELFSYNTRLKASASQPKSSIPKLKNNISILLHPSMAEDAVANQDPNIGFDQPPSVSGSPDSISSFVYDIEQFLMEDIDWGCATDGPEKDGADDFFSDISLAASDSLHGDALTIEGQNKEEKKISVLIGVEEVEEEEDDFVSKKRRRQMRNRESAMISRERKKMYINDLEKKNKHLDSECRRLQYALRCSMAETIDLRQKLQFQTIRPCGAFMARQESAVLFMESLLLGSLFWFVSLAGLLLFPCLRNLSPNLKEVSRSGRSLITKAARIVSIISVNSGGDLKPEFLRLRRRCRGTRGRIKYFLFPLHAVLS